MFDHGSKIFSLLFLALFPHGSNTATMPEMFDYIVVGGGTAGKPTSHQSCAILLKLILFLLYIQAWL
jgi:hypothetical protein